jgi:hypothetical protein
MKVALFTTYNLHHLRFTQKLAEKFDLSEIVFEKKTYQAPFKTQYTFEQKEELSQDIKPSLDLLKQYSKVSTQYYYYPEGLEHTFNTYVIEFLKKSGITCSPSAEDGINTIESSLFHLKHIMIG